MGGGCSSSSSINEENRKPIDDKDKALLDCKLCRDKIKQFIKRLERNAQKKREKAKDLLKAKQRDRAKNYLRQNKFHLEQVKVAEGQLNMVEDQIYNLESAYQQAEALKVLQNGNKVLKELQTEMNIEKWEKVGDDMRDIKDQQEEIAEFFKNHNVNNDEYEKEVDKELSNLNSELQFPEAQKDDIHLNEQNSANKRILLEN